MPSMVMRELEMVLVAHTSKPWRISMQRLSRLSMVLTGEYKKKPKELTSS